MITKKRMAELVQRHMRYEDEDNIKCFEYLIRQGFEPVFAAMHATRSYPGVVGTDTQFRQGNDKQVERMPAKVRREMLKRPGYSGNAVFHNQLGEWVESKADIKRACERKNKTLHDEATGAVIHQGHYTPEVRPPLREDIVRQRMVQYAAKDPGLVSTPAKVKKLREDVINKHTPHWRRKSKIIE